MRQSVDVLTTTNYYNPDSCMAWWGSFVRAVVKLEPGDTQNWGGKKSSAANRRYCLCLQGKQLTDHVKGLTVWNWTLQPPLLHISEWVCPRFWILTVKSHLAVHCEDLNSRCLFVFSVGIPHGFVELMIRGAFQHFGFLKKSFKAKLYLTFNNLQMSFTKWTKTKILALPAKKNK